ncbi:MAG: PEP-utilizing enzyme [Bacillota bacterium]|nr:PEP-utilizing enzyme [Bacillota bacterium]
MKYSITPFEFNEELDLQHHKAWFLDPTHAVPPWTPMVAWFWINYCRHGMQWAAEKLPLPNCKGWDWRLKDGCGYLTMLIVDDPKEIWKREIEFKKNLLPFIENYDKEWLGFIKEMLSRYEEIQIFEEKTASNIELLEHFEKTLELNKRMWEIHFYMMYVVFGVFILFESMCKELLGIDDTHSDFHTLIRGFDNKVFQVDKKIWEFSRQARKAGLSNLFVTVDPKDYCEALDKTAEGKKWLGEFKRFLQESGWQANRKSFEFNLPLWVEDPTPALVYVKLYLQKKEEQFVLDKEREKLALERTATEKKLLEKIPLSKRKWFTEVMKLAQKSSAFSEEHNVYLDLYTHALLRKVLMEWGKRLKEAGSISQVDDILFLIPDEIRKAAVQPTHCNLKPIVKERQQEWAKWCDQEKLPMISTINTAEAMDLMLKSNDPIVLKVVVGSFPVPKPDLKADLYGVPGAPGIAEGPARVVRTDEDLAEIKENEIMVAPSTYPSWTPAFSLLKGVIVDRGASLSQAAIVGREYNIPVVLNVFEGSKRIKTGQRVCVDGNMGVVYILEK